MTVEAHGQTPGHAASCGHQPQTAVTGCVLRVGIAKIRNRLSVGRPRRQRTGATTWSELHGLAPRSVHHEDVLGMVVVTVVVASRDKRNAAAIGRPGRLDVVPLAIGELAGLTSGRIDDKQVSTA